MIVSKRAMFVVTAFVLVVGARFVFLKFMRPVSVLAASWDLPLHSILDAKMVDVKHITREQQKPEMILVNSRRDAEQAIKGKATTVTLRRGEPILSSNLIDRSPDVAEGPPRLPPGTRGYLLQFPKASAPIVEPGQHVDVSVIYGSSDHRVNEIVARNVLLMATGDGIGTYKGLAILTLAVKPDEAAKLDRAKKRQQATISVQMTSSQAQ